MACILFTESHLAALKAKLREEYAGLPEVKSSHLSEALGRALGFNTHAAALVAARNLNRMPAPEDDYRPLNDAAFRVRLQQLTGVHVDDELDDFEIGDYPGVIVNDPGDEIEYRTEREKAWRNLIVAGVNAGLSAGLFTIRPADNRWPDAANRSAPSSAHGAFDLDPGLPALAWFSDAGFGELNVGVVVNPSASALRLGRGFMDFRCGDAIAEGWLERERGAWIQSSTTRFMCRRALQLRLAALVVTPRCFGDRGKVMM